MLLITCHNFGALQRILDVQYSIPENIEISPECRHLLSRIFVEDPAQVDAQSFLITILQLIWHYIITFSNYFVYINRESQWRR